MENGPVQAQLGSDWASMNGTHAIGYAFLDGEGHTAADIAALLDAEPELDPVLERLNGFFAVVSQRGDETHLVADRLASHALFYGRASGTVYVSDDADWVRDQVGDESYAPTAELEYLLSGYVTGRRTLSPNVAQVVSGERVVVSEESDVRRHRWFRFPGTGESSHASTESLLRALDDVYLNVYERLIEYADGRPIVVSLSAGHDSRLNLLMLSRLGYENLLALTYAEEDAETNLCKRIVDDLGVPWIYTGETHQQWFEWYNSSERERFEAASDYLHRLPTLGTVMGVKTVHEQELIPNDAVFVTGDGVISTGEHLMPAIVEADELAPGEVYERIAASHYKFWNWGDDVADVLHRRVEAGLDDVQIETPTDGVRALERWDWQERQSKFIPRNYTYDFWDYDWWLPLWDAELVDFWRRLPVDRKFDKQLHRRYVEWLHREVADVDQSRVSESVWSGADLSQRLKNALLNTKLDPTGSRFDKLARKVYFRYFDPLAYDSRADFGIMRREQFEGLQTGLLTVHAFQALEVLDRVSFDPPRNHGVPDSMGEVLDSREVDRPQTAVAAVSSGTTTRE